MILRLSLLLLFFLPHVLEAQTLTGIIIDNQTGEPIDAATIFFTNTTYGALSNPDGSFSLSAPMGKSELVISHISYRMQKRAIVFDKKDETKERKIRMAAESKDLQTITVSSKQDKKWRRDLKKFKKLFFGKTKNATQCEIINPTVLQFEKKGEVFKASASDILRIENQSLGYNVYFLLEHFQSEGQSITYAGKPYFEEIKPTSEKQQKNWNKKREIAYNGSLPHFLYALLNDRLQSEGFEINKAKLKNNKSFFIESSLSPKDLIIYKNNKSNPVLSFDDFLQVVYHGEKDGISGSSNNFGRSATNLGHPAEKDLIEQDNSMMKGNVKNQTSYLFARKSKISLDTFGYLSRPELLIEYGYWNKEGVADMVPRNFKNQRSVPIEIPKSDETDRLLGFEMTNLRIPEDEIKKGGPPKDGIPAIDHPKFVSIEQAQDFLNPDDYILGVEINGITKAYPIRILNYHEIVNDRIAEVPIAITYCPLCASGAAFSARVNGQELTFGVSGLLYNSDVLIYDRQTESLWSQILSEAVSGPLSSDQLELIPTTYTTFESWAKQYPNSLILSTDTGFKKDYTKTPYQKYVSSDKLLFPVSFESDILNKKDKVIGIEVDGKFKAYPLKNLEKSEGVIQDIFNGQELNILYDKTAKSAIITDKDGKKLSSMTLYWFAWFTFHPKTKIY